MWIVCSLKQKPLRFIVLIPHRESLRLLENYRQRLFTQGIAGAYAFPSVALLALISREFSIDELKALARDLRDTTLSKNGKISAEKAELLSFPQTSLGKNTALFGPALDLPSLENISGLNNEKVLIRFPKIILCAAFLGKENEPGPPGGIQNVVDLQRGAVDSPVLSFRSAKVSNLAICPLGAGTAAYSFKWRLGPECWLPSYKKHKSM